MGLFDSKELNTKINILEGSNKSLESQVEVLKALLEQANEEKEHLRRQVDKLQEALFSKESPVAYNWMKMDEAHLETPEEKPEDKARRLREQNTWMRVIDEIDKPTFQNFDELMSAFTSVGPESENEN